MGCFKPSFNKLINVLLYLSPVGTLAFKYHTVDSEAAVHLEIENGFCLFKDQETVFLLGG